LQGSGRGQAVRELLAHPDTDPATPNASFCRVLRRNRGLAGIFETWRGHRLGFTRRADNEKMTDSPNGDADYEMSEAFSKALDDMRALGRRINDTTASTEDVWFRNLLLGIIDCALKDHHNAKSGIQKFVPLAAWATRNLLELRIVTAYVLKSASNANQFKIELMIDVKEFYENVSKSTAAGHNKTVAMMREVAEQQQGPMRDVFMKMADMEAAKDPQTEISDREADACRKLLMSDFGIKDRQQPKTHGTLAREVQQHEDFAPLNKICSKITHRTAFSIASSTVNGSLDEVIPFLSSVADTEILSIYGMIGDYVRDNGVRPPR
jgi:hypothetical protein